MKKNDILRMQIVDMTSDGDGVAKSEDGQVVFVKDSAVDDVCDIRIVKVKKNYAYGKIEKIIIPSKHRVDPDCDVSRQCGGCVYRHINYQSELDIKRKKVMSCISRIGGIDENLVVDIIGASDCVDRYRNKALIPMQIDSKGNVAMGFYGQHSHRVVDCADCKLSPKIFTDITDTVKVFVNKHPYLLYDEQKHSGKLRHLYLRIAQATEEIMVCFVVNGRSFDHQQELFNSIIEKYPQVKSIVINVNTKNTNVVLGTENITVYGKDTITDVLCGLSFELSPLSFYQVNRTQAQRLYEKAREYALLDSDDVLLDLYCGTGTIGLTMASECKQLVGVEIVADAIKNAKKNARLNKIENAQFYCMDATQAAAKLDQDGLKPSVIIVDPPRKGLTPELIDTITDMAPKRVVYVSCDPATLSRDLKQFEENNYSVKEITAVDLFPRTAHIESVCLLKAKDK